MAEEKKVPKSRPLPKRRPGKDIVSTGGDAVAVDELVAEAVRKFKPTERPFDPDEYSDVVSAAKLVRIALVNSFFTVMPEMAAGTVKMKDCNLRLTRKCLETTFHPEESLGVGMFEFGAAAYRKGKRSPDTEPLMEIGTVYMVFYGLPADLNGAAVTEFLRRVGMMAAYPYFRNMAAQYGWASAIDLPIMPVLK